ncbi:MULTISPECIES: hypothetical protein [Crateriforma]|uniref:YHS domain protein n=1 Tax=Crateriforma conspicua TaxID=2527996 RepID=A0A5C6FWE0_9PLAN|nr:MULTISPECIES: hypothetical protein [Crateriforma]TWU65628.1 hypothetical protein V7x_11760 [Crateriforma conspicua]
MRIAIFTAVVAVMTIPASAHHPNRETTPVIPRVDLLPPLGNCLPEGYRRKYNRPTYIGGKIAYYIAPSSQEAMAWHRAEHRGDYECKRGRVVPQYFYQKPYEALKIGGRKDVNAPARSEQTSPSDRLEDVQLREVDEKPAGDMLPELPVAPEEDDLDFSALELIPLR